MSSNFGIPVNQEPKYGVNEQGRLINRETCNVIPDDEPVFILRGRDIHAVQVMTDYLNMLSVPGHKNVVRQRIADFQKFRHENPGRMREPGAYRQQELIEIESPNWQYIITMPDGSRWSVPVEVIARDRAKEYAHEFNDELSLSLHEDTIPLFRSDEYSIEDWAKNNMNWKDVEPFATQISGPQLNDLQSGWCNGDAEVINA